MRWKRLISLVSIVAFSLSMFAATPSFAETTEGQRNVVLGLVVAALFVGILAMANTLDDEENDFNDVQENSDNLYKLPLNMKLELGYLDQDIHQLGYLDQDIHRESLDSFTPMMKIKIPF